jgi:hypothetical protein
MIGGVYSRATAAACNLSALVQIKLLTLEISFMHLLRELAMCHSNDCVPSGFCLTAKQVS